MNGMQHLFGIGRTERVFHLFHIREWNRLRWNRSKSRNRQNSGDRFRWASDLRNRIIPIAQLYHTFPQAMR